MRLFLKSLSRSLPVFILVLGSSTHVMAQELDTETKKLSYMFGMDIGNTLKRNNVEVDLTILLKAVEDTLTGKEPLLSPEEAQTLKQSFFQKVQAQRAEEAKAVGEKNSAEGDAFLAENKDKEGVITTGKRPTVPSHQSRGRAQTQGG